MKNKLPSLLMVSLTFLLIVGFSPTRLKAESNTDKLLVLLVNFNDSISTPFTLEQVQQKIFGGTANSSLNQYYSEVSYGKLNLTGQVSGWYSLSISPTCNKNTVMSAAVAAADVDVDFSENYGTIMVVAPFNCGWA